jgi:two-component system, OmpR family, sensor kinase
MRPLHSIRWQLLLWQGVLLALVLTGFGVTAWRLERATRFQRVDQELERNVAGVAEGVVQVRGPAPRPRTERPPQDRPRPPQDDPSEPPPRPPAERDNPQPPPVTGRAPERVPRPFDGASGNVPYYVAWSPQGAEISRSGAAPREVPRPAPGAEQRFARSRATFREYVNFAPTGECILVGRDISDELAGMRRFAWLLTGAGFAVFVLGLAGGWMVSTRSLRPIRDISATAVRISSGDLGQRIAVADASSELGDLARVLNDTFARLQASFVRQAQFTADASHELRTPLSIVLTETQAALSRERPNAEYRDSLIACEKSARRMRRLIESLLALARFDSGDGVGLSVPCDLATAAKEALSLILPVAQQRGVSVVTDLSPAICEADAEQLGTVLTNLLSNAVYHSRPGDSVRMETAVHADSAVVRVSDTGDGIKADDLPHIFDRFYRGDKARSNADGRVGLGLAITKAIVEAHGGTISAASEVGRGSTFIVRLPAAGGSAGANESA